MEKQNKNKKTLYIVIAVIVIFFVIAAASSGTDDNENVADTSNEETTSEEDTTTNSSETEVTKVRVADFSEMSEDEIEEWCDDNNINCSIKEKYSDDVASGEFISQSVDYGKKVEEESKITITFSKGVEPTTGMKNALSRALSYLNYSAFSRSGLIKQLEYEGYTEEEAEYAVDNCGADWYEQAVKKAKEYLDYTSFSKSGLIKQLEYEGFTSEQAEYGAEQNGF